MVITVFLNQALFQKESKNIRLLNTILIHLCIQYNKIFAKF